MGSTTWTYQELLEFNRRQGKAFAKELTTSNQGHAEDEADLHNAIIDYCKSKGWIYLHGSMAHKTFRCIGEWDFTIVADKGRTFFVECKKTGGKLTTEQAGLHARALKLGHVVYTIYCMEEFEKLFV